MWPKERMSLTPIAQVKIQTIILIIAAKTMIIFKHREKMAMDIKSQWLQQARIYK